VVSNSTKGGANSERASTDLLQLQIVRTSLYGYFVSVGETEYGFELPIEPV
jgi:hypothetical protein